MKRTRGDGEEEEGEVKWDDEEEQKRIDVADMHREPKWIFELSAYLNGEREYGVLPRFDDDSWEWDQCTYDTDQWYVPVNRGNRMLPIGFMLRRGACKWICDFLEMRPDVSIYDPCCWIEHVPYSPLQMTNLRQMRERRHFLGVSHVDALWSAGVRLKGFSSGIGDDMLIERVLKCKSMEDSIMAMVWCCRQAQGTLWNDNALPISERMRRMDVGEWVVIRNESDYQEWLKTRKEEEN
jgi:hypothetical protein